jgi:hypothetical protein
MVGLLYSNSFHYIFNLSFGLLGVGGRSCSLLSVPVDFGLVCLELVPDITRALDSPDWQARLHLRLGRSEVR